ncbi:MAG: hypothetical protein U9Q69_01220 [Nanoarchaeota archaeon]|nr:hypothetical protein [Nanoarchaeota archaeon]
MFYCLLAMCVSYVLLFFAKKALFRKKAIKGLGTTAHRNLILSKDGFRRFIARKSDFQGQLNFGGRLLVSYWQQQFLQKTLPIPSLILALGLCGVIDGLLLISAAICVMLFCIGSFAATIYKLRS